MKHRVKGRTEIERGERFFVCAQKGVYPKLPTLLAEIWRWLFCSTHTPSYSMSRIGARGTSISTVGRRMPGLSEWLSPGMDDGSVPFNQFSSCGRRARILISTSPSGRAHLKEVGPILRSTFSGVHSYL